MPDFPDITDTNDLRRGVEINSQLLAVLPLVGGWGGYGAGVVPAKNHSADTAEPAGELAAGGLVIGELADGEEFSYAQRVSFSHDGRPFLAYSSHTWLLKPDGSVLRPASRENGFLRVGPGADDLELVLALATGIVEVFTGIAGDQRWELATKAVGLTPTAKSVSGEKRLYALTGETLAYAQELAIEPGDYRPHLSARLNRVPS